MLWRAAHTWQQIIDEWTVWLIAGQAAAATVYQRRWQLRRLAVAHPGRSPWKLTGDDLTRWLTGQGWGPEAMKSSRSALRSFYRWGLDTGRTRRDPSAKLPKVRVGRHLPRPAAHDHVDRVLAVADPRTRLMVMLAYWATLRTRARYCRASARCRAMSSKARWFFFPVLSDFAGSTPASARKRLTTPMSRFG